MECHRRGGQCEYLVISCGKSDTQSVWAFFGVKFSTKNHWQEIAGRVVAFVGLTNKTSDQAWKNLHNFQRSFLENSTARVFEHLDPDGSLGNITIRNALSKVLTTVKATNSEQTFTGVERSRSVGIILVYERQYQSNVDGLIYNFQAELERINAGPIPDSVLPALRRNNTNGS